MTTLNRYPEWTLKIEENIEMQQHTVYIKFRNGVLFTQRFSNALWNNPSSMHFIAKSLTKIIKRELANTSYQREFEL